MPVLQGPETDPLDGAAARGIAKKLRTAAKTHTRRQEHDISKRIACAVWSTKSSSTPALERGSPGDMYSDKFQEHLDAKRSAKPISATWTAPFHEERNAAATWHRQDASTTLDKVLTAILQEKEAPNAQQHSFLKHFIRRLKLEILEMQQRTTERSSQEPLLDLTHGFPGTGKSKLIKWMRTLMEDGLGWTHGIQFVCLAFQNAMAAQINGFTVHHWSGIPARMADGGACGDKHKLSIKCQALRVIIIDEISMIDAELLGSLEYMVSSVIRQGGTYKRRTDGSKRLFGWGKPCVVRRCLAAAPSLGDALV